VRGGVRQPAGGRAGARPAACAEQLGLAPPARNCCARPLLWMTSRRRGVCCADGDRDGGSTAAAHFFLVDGAVRYSGSVASPSSLELSSSSEELSSGGIRPALGFWPRGGAWLVEGLAPSASLSLSLSLGGIMPAVELWPAPEARHSQAEGQQHARAGGQSGSGFRAAMAAQPRAPGPPGRPGRRDHANARPAAHPWPAGAPAPPRSSRARLPPPSCRPAGSCPCSPSPWLLRCPSCIEPTGSQLRLPRRRDNCWQPV
jgi:hypothetical protein